MASAITREDSKCGQLAISISPNNLKIFNDPEMSRNLFRCLGSGAAKLAEIKAVDSKLVGQHLMVRQKLEERALFDSYFGRIEFYRRIRDRKVQALETYLPLLLSDYRKALENIASDFEAKLGEKGRSLITPEEFASASEEEKAKIIDESRKLEELNLRFVTILGAYISLAFFAFEESARVTCSLVCLPFAFDTADITVRQHKDIFDTLKMLSRIKFPTICKVCVAESSCHYDFDFESLSHVYAYIMNVRMLSDYTEVFYSIPGFWRYVVDVYFPSVVKIISALKIQEDGIQNV